MTDGPEIRILRSGEDAPSPTPAPKPPVIDDGWMTVEERAYVFLDKEEGTVLGELLALMAAPPTDITERENARHFVGKLRETEVAGANRAAVVERLFAYEVLLKGPGSKKVAKKDETVVGTIGEKDKKSETADAPKVSVEGNGPGADAVREALTPGGEPEPALGLEPVDIPGTTRRETSPLFGGSLDPEEGIPEPVRFEATPYEATLIATALTHRKEDLDKLAKKTSEEGYPTEARRIGNDAGTIGEVILPRFKAQQELALATPVEVRSAIANRLRETVRRALVKKDPDIESVLGGLAGLVEPLLTGAVDRAYAAGLAARHHDPNVIILKAIEAATMAKFEET